MQGSQILYTARRPSWPSAWLGRVDGEATALVGLGGLNCCCASTSISIAHHCRAFHGLVLEWWVVARMPQRWHSCCAYLHVEHLSDCTSTSRHLKKLLPFKPRGLLPQAAVRLSTKLLCNCKQAQCMVQLHAGFCYQGLAQPIPCRSVALGTASDVHIYQLTNPYVYL